MMEQIDLMASFCLMFSSMRLGEYAAVEITDACHRFNRMDKFFDRLANDLETYAGHAKRKTIDVEDAVLLLKRLVCCAQSCF